MKLLGLLLTSIFALSLSLTAIAQDYGVFGGFNSSEFDSSRSWDREFGIELGATANIELQNRLSLRTGAGIVQKNSSAKTPAGKQELSVTYIEIPGTLFFAATSTIGFFGGLNLDLKVADDCDFNGGSCDPDTETIVINLPLGARFNIQDDHNIEPILELGVTDIADDVKLGNTLSIRYIYMFGKR